MACTYKFSGLEAKSRHSITILTTSFPSDVCTQRQLLENKIAFNQGPYTPIQITTTRRNGDDHQPSSFDEDLSTWKAFQSVRSVLYITDIQISAQQQICMFLSRKEGNPASCRVESCIICHCLKSSGSPQGRKPTCKVRLLISHCQLGYPSKR